VGPRSARLIIKSEQSTLPVPALGVSRAVGTAWHTATCRPAPRPRHPPDLSLPVRHGPTARSIIARSTQALRMMTVRRSTLINERTGKAARPSVRAGDDSARRGRE
jgi:hypothetical protein